MDCKNTVKLSILPKAILTSMQSLSKYYGIFHRTRTNDPKICMEPEKSTNSKAGLRKNKDGSITCPDFKV